MVGRNIDDPETRGIILVTEKIRIYLGEERLTYGETGLLLSWMSRLPCTLSLQILAMTTVILTHYHSANDVACKGQKMESPIP